MHASFRCLLFAAALSPQRTRAQSAPASTPNIAALMQSVERARAALSGVPALSGFDASDVQWIFTDGRLHLASARMEGRDAVQVITLPPGTTIANTAVAIDGKRWAMIVLDLTRAEGATVPLLVHEAMHTFQPDRLPAPGPTEAGVGGALLDGADGRAWLFLELRALAIALTTTGRVQQRAAHDALVFRARRDALAAPTERRRLDVLDQIEGIPEYTGLSPRPNDRFLARNSAATYGRATRVFLQRPMGNCEYCAYGILSPNDSARGGCELTPHESIP